MKLFLLVICLGTIVFSADFKTCDEWLAKYNKWSYNYVKFTKLDDRKNAKISISMTKSYQDDLLSKCSGVIDLRRIRNFEETTNMGYKIFYK